MGKRGRPRKIVVETEKQVSVPVVATSVVVMGRPAGQENPMISAEAETQAVVATSCGRMGCVMVPALSEEEKAIQESRKSLVEKLDQSQSFFESPEGYIIIGGKDQSRIWCGKANHGKGCWINRMR